MLPPTKVLTEWEQEQWDTLLSNGAFMNRTTGRNQKEHRKALNINKSTAKKWRDYYSHDSGNCRMTIESGAAFQEAQLFDIGRLTYTPTTGGTHA